MKEQRFHRVGSSEKEATYHLIWTLTWAFIAFALSVVSVFHL